MPRVIVAVVLAAGESRRFGGFPKPLLTLEGQTLLARVCRGLRSERVGAIRVVTGHQHDQVAEEAARCGAEVVRNPDYRRGMLSSVVAGIAGLTEAAVEAVLLAPVDQPLFEQATVVRLIDRFQAGAGSIVVPIYRRLRGHPVLFAATLLDELRGAPADLGARAVVRADPTRVAEVEVDDPGVVFDLDDPPALESARAHLRRSEVY
jgi:CTP:molybdopterin cytidylyltransferase MocA